MSDRSIQTTRGLQLDRVVLLGRTFDEYRRYFLLQPHELIGKRVLDVAGGVSSFCAEANDFGIKVTAFDPIYSQSREKIRERSDPDLESVYQTIGLVPTYRWGFYKNPDYMRTLRERASNIFFSDFKVHPERYVAGKLPRLPFADGEFDLTLVSYLLFAYQDRFDYEFHRDSILEIMRVTRRSAHLSDRDLPSAAKRICSDAAIRSGAATVRFHRNQNRFRISAEFQFLPARDARVALKL
jgi:SAM-dependent methyltransferase